MEKKHGGWEQENASGRLSREGISGADIVDEYGRNGLQKETQLRQISVSSGSKGSRGGDRKGGGKRGGRGKIQSGLVR